MSSAVADPQVAASLTGLDAAIDRLGGLDVDLASISEANAYGRELETAARRVDALRARFVNQVHRSGVHKVDGHASAKVMTRHLGNLSSAEALRRDKAGPAPPGMPLVGAGREGGGSGAG